MDDRNLVAVAEQAAATSRVLRGPIAGCTLKADDGRVFLGCRLEFSDAALDQDPIEGGLAQGRVQGMRRVVRVGYYSPTGGELPRIPEATLRRLHELAAPDLVVIFSPGSGERIERSLSELRRQAGIE